MAFPLVLIPITLALAKGASGYFAARKAKKEQEALQQPMYNIQNEYYQNKNIAANEAQTGLSGSALSYLTKENQRGLGSTISAIEQTGATPNSISEILDNYNNNLENIGLQDTQLHTAKIGEYMNRNIQLADQKTTQWAQNVLYPYQNKLQLLHQNQLTGKQNMWGGLSDAASIASSYAMSGMNNDLKVPNGSNSGGASSNALSQILSSYNSALRQPNESYSGGGQPANAQVSPQGTTQSSLFQPANQLGTSNNLLSDADIQQYNDLTRGE